MVVGKGLLAKTFETYKTSKEILIFASGVSNSKETNPNAFKREFELLKATISNYPNAKLVYFSTVSITDASVNNSAYVQHKIKLENYIKAQTHQYLILRVSNVVGAIGNSNTIMNFLVAAVKEQQEITIWSKAERNFIDVEDVFCIVDALLTKNASNRTINVAMSESLLVKDVLKQIENFLGNKARVSYVNKGNALPIDVSDITHELNIVEAKNGNGQTYIMHMLEKYYAI